MPLHRLPIHSQDRVEKDQVRVVRLHDVAESIQGEACPGPTEFAPGQVDTDGREHATAHHQAPENHQRSGVPAACGRRQSDAFLANDKSLCVYAGRGVVYAATHEDFTAPTPWSWTNRPQPRWCAVLAYLKHRSTLLLELVAYVKFCKEGYELTLET